MDIRQLADDFNWEIILDFSIELPMKHCINIEPP